MNIYVLIAGLLVFFGFLAHTFVGTKETLTTRVEFSDALIEKNWYQSFTAWHLVTADLLLSSILLILIAATDIFEDKRTITLIFALQFLAWTVSALITMIVTNGREYFRQLYQWAFFLIVSAILFYGMDRF